MRLRGSESWTILRHVSLNRFRPGLWLRRKMPKGLFARALLIIITPMVLLQSMIAYTFMERHWQTVTQRLSAVLTQDIAAIIDMRQLLPNPTATEELERLVLSRMNLDIDFLPLEPLPPALPKPFFEILDESLSAELRRQVARPFFIDTVGRSNLIEIRVQLDDSVLRVIARRSQAYASNSHIFLVWMVGTSMILLTIAILFLRNQIRPIQALFPANTVSVLRRQNRQRSLLLIQRIMMLRLPKKPQKPEARSHSFLPSSANSRHPVSRWKCPPKEVTALNWN